MSEFLRAFIYLLVLGTIGIYFTKKAFVGTLVEEREFNRWRNAWYIVTALGFLTQNFYIFCALLIVYLIRERKYQKTVAALYLLLLPSFPDTGVHVFFGGLDLFYLTYIFALAAGLLIPAYVATRGQRRQPFTAFGILDYLCIALLILYIGLNASFFNFTTGLRDGLDRVTQIFFPFYVISRTVRSVDDFKRVAVAFVLISVITSIVLFFESQRWWLLYNTVDDVLGAPWGLGNYLPRGDFIRAAASMGQPIISGYVISLGILLYTVISKYVTQKWLKLLIWGILLVGIYAPLSRGPWLGALVMVGVFLATGKNAIYRLGKFVAVLALAFGVLTQLPGGERYLNLLPFIGKTDAGTVEYREKLLEHVDVMVAKNFWFGTIDYREDPYMQDMRQGENIVDIVNSYINVVMESGIIGFTLYVLFFVIVVVQTYNALRYYKDPEEELVQFGRGAFALMLGSLFTIYTVSSIGVIPPLHYAAAGLCMAFVYITRLKKMEARQQLREQMAIAKHGRS